MTILMHFFTLILAFNLRTLRALMIYFGICVLFMFRTFALAALLFFVVVISFLFSFLYNFVIPLAIFAYSNHYFSANQGIMTFNISTSKEML